MMRYVRISTFSRSAEARALESGRTWKPTMIAFEALASSTSESVMAPTPRCTTSTLTSGVDSCASASASASAGPPWSALMMIRSAAAPPSARSAMKSSSVFTRPERRCCASRSSRCRVGHDLKGVARLGHAFEAQHLHRSGRTCARHGLPALVVHRPHPAIELPADEVVPTAQRAVLDEDRGERTLAGVERRLEHGALRAPLGVGLEI